MTARPHRFLQYLQEFNKKERWHEISALGGRSAGARHTINAVAVDSPGRVLRDVKAGIRVVLKWLVRGLYLSPILIAVRFVLDAANPSSGDMLVVAFVLLVVSFFLIINLYIIWSVVVHFRSKGKLHVQLPFGEAGEDRTGLFAKELGEDGAMNRAVKLRGVVKRVDELLPDSGLVIRDLWAAESAAPWRLVEATDFAVVANDERPMIVQLGSAPIVVASPRKETVGWAIHQLSPGVGSIFDMGPATEGERASEPVQWLTVAEGDTVEVIGFEHGTIDDVEHFMLDGRSCAVLLGEEQTHGPYRGAATGKPGTLVISSPETPVWIRKVS